MLPLLVFSSLIGCALSINPTTRNSIAQPKSTSAEYLLPNQLTVSLYEVALEPDFETDTFNGSVRVTFTTLNATNVVVFHVDHIEINNSSIRLFGSDGFEINNRILSTVSSDDDRQFYFIWFQTSLEESTSYTIEIAQFTGILHLDNYGFYLARYVDENGQIRKLATTQFQATAARRAFPCFDEPALKAQFDISIIRDASRHSLANTPLESTAVVAPGRFLDKFRRTVVMSTYLVAFIVSDFSFVQSGIQKVYGRPVLINEGRGDYPLELGQDILYGISEFVRVNYTLDKLDQVAIPDGYFSAGAMENWGLITYREEYLLYSSDITDSDTKEFIAIIVAHELGHQWFGNLVSPLWWRYLWLNEGFATYFEYYGGDMNNYDFQLSDQMVIKSVQRALSRDSSATTRHMNQDAGSPADVNALFDIVAYDKAGAVIRMAEAILTRDVFKAGLTIFLNKLEFGVAEPEDLYSSWQQALNQSGLNLLPNNDTVSSIMRTWDSNPGYPLLTVTRNYVTGSVTFSQRRFIDSNIQNTDPSIWSIPISYVTANNSNASQVTPKLWLTTNNLITTLDGLFTFDWLIVNVRQYGYFRVNYDMESWNRINIYLNTLDIKVIDRLNRAQIIDDSFTLARFGALSYNIPLEISRYIERETDYIAMYPFFNALSYLDIHLANTNGSYNTFQNYIRQILNTSYVLVGMNEVESDAHLTKLQRENVLTWVCRYNDSNCLNESLVNLRLWMWDENFLIPPTLQTPQVCAALRTANQTEWEWVYGRYASDSELVVRRRLLRALGCTLNANILNLFVQEIVSQNSSLLATDRVAAFASIYNSGVVGLNFAFNYIQSYFDVITNAFTVPQRNSIINGIAARLTTSQQLVQLQNLGSASSGTDMETTFSNAISTVGGNVQWSNQYLPTIVNWLESV